MGLRFDSTCMRLFRGRSEKAAPGDDHAQHDEAAGPYTGLTRQAEHRFNDQGISQQRDQRTEVRRTIEEIRIVGLRVTRAREPGLQERRVRRHRKERQSNACCQYADQPQIGIAGRGFGSERGQAERQAQRRDRHQSQVNEGRLPGWAIAVEQMRVAITAEQHGLEEHHRYRPNRGGTAKLRQHHLGEDRLYREQQQRGHKQRHREYCQHRCVVAQPQEAPRNRRAQCNRTHEPKPHPAKNNLWGKRSRNRLNDDLWGMKSKR